MKKLMLLTLILSMFLTFAASAATVLIEDCEDDTLFTTTLDDDDVAITVTNDADATEGSNSVLCSLQYGEQLAWYGGSYVKRTFTTPVDISEMDFLTYDLKVPTSHSTYLMATIELTDQNGYKQRFTDDAFAAATGGWIQKSYKISDLVNNTWLAGAHSVDLKAISEIAWNVQKHSDTTGNPGTFDFYIDNINILTDTGSRNETVIFDFEGYADSTAINVDFAPAWSGALKTTLALEETNPYTGAKAINIESNDVSQWQSYVGGYDLPAPMDFSAAKYVQFALYGNSLLNTLDPTGRVILEDGNGDRCAGYAWGAPKNDAWTVMHMPFGGGIFAYAAGKGCWREDKWDAGGEFGGVDLTNIVKIYIGFDCQGAVTPTVIADVIIDDVVVGFETSAIPVPSVNSYIVAETATPVIDGTVTGAEWDAAGAGCTGFVVHSDGVTAAAEDPTVKALYDADALYILWEVPEANASLDFSPTGGARDPSGTAFTGDDYELFLAPGGNVASDYYHIVFFPNQADGICYVWDEFSAGGAGTWDATGDSAAFSYVGGVMTIEYRIPFSAFNNAAAVVNGTQNWGVQLGFINDVDGGTTIEAVNWEPDTTAGFAAGRPFGTWTFANVLDVNEWTLY